MREAAFLIEPAREGYPTDYLLSRIGRRRRDLVTDWEAAGAPDAQAIAERPFPAPGTTAGEARARMHREYRWVYLQMNRDLREIFAPFFLWHELRTILTALRFLRAGARERVAALLETSLLGERVQRVLRGEEKPFNGRDALSELVESDRRRLREMGTWYGERKGREYEERFLALHLERTSRLKLHPVLREFFGRLIDHENLLALAKQLHWKLREPQAFISGGTIPEKRLEKALDAAGENEPARLLRSLPGLGALSALPDDLEHLLLRRLGEEVRRLGWEPLGIGSILAYLWECRTAVLNAGLLQHAAPLGEEALKAELIR